MASGLYSIYQILYGATTLLSVDDFILAPIPFQLGLDVQTTGFVGGSTVETFDRGNRQTPFSFTKFIVYDTPELAAIALMNAIIALPAGRQDLAITISGQTGTYNIRKTSITGFRPYVTEETGGFILYLEYSIMGGVMTLETRTTDDGTSRTVDDGSSRTMA